MSLLLQARRQLAPLLLLVSSVVAGCGDYSIYNGKMSDPWDPGPRKEGSGYGSGSGSGMMPPPPPMCDVSERRCEQEFVYRGMGGTSTKGDEKVVELRGDHKANGWVTGDVMTFDGTAWRVKVTVPWVSKFLYKFRIVDATGKESWIADPENPNKESDGFGGFNSVGSGVTCATYKCEAPPPKCEATAGSFDWRDAVLYFVFVDRFFDGNPANNVGISSHAVDNSNVTATAADLALTITHTPQKLLPGQDVTYTAQVTNNGMEFLAPLTKLETLSLGGNKISGVGLHILKSLPHLKHLNLSGAQKRNSGTWGTTLTEADLGTLATLTNLESLNLGGTRVTNTGLARLKTLTHLRELDLSKTQITSTALATLTNMPALTELKLWKAAEIKDDAIPHLAALRKLTLLDIADTSITPEAAASLRKQLPNCKVLGK